MAAPTHGTPVRRAVDRPAPPADDGAHDGPDDAAGSEDASSTRLPARSGADPQVQVDGPGGQARAPEKRLRRVGTVRRVVEVGAAVLVVAAVLWCFVQVVSAVALLAGALGAALVLTALLEPLARGLRRLGVPAWLAATVATVALVAALAAVALLVYSRATSQLGQLPSVLSLATEQARTWLITGPLQLDPSQVSDLRNVIVERLNAATPTPLAGAVTALRALTAAILVVFTVFFLLKDGASMWRWLLSWTPARRRQDVDTAGSAAWRTLSSYVRGIIVVATVDAVAIGAALLLLDVPLWLSLTVLTFFGAFLPIIGATIAGAVAVAVTLVLEGGRDAVIVLVVVVLVQQLEGNLLHPLIMGRALRLHPLAVLCAVTAGGLLLGAVGALIAVPITAVTYSALAALRARREADAPAPDQGEPAQRSP